VLVPPNDVRALASGILRVARDDRGRAAMREASRARAVAQFSLAEMVRRYAALYGHQLKLRSQRAPAHAEHAPAE
jgi:glycosyltransferase involved in cell wall biosynthesis